MTNQISNQRLPPECVQCGKAASGICPHHMGERRHVPPSHRLLRVLRPLRKLLPIDGTLPGGYSLPPDVIVFVPTLSCNLSCSYCFQRVENRAARQSHPEGDLSLIEWQTIIDEVKSLGLPVIVMGGELFLYLHAIELLRQIKAADLPLTVITNGTALPRVAAELVSIGLNWLIVSLDGPPEVHNIVRGHPRGFELAAEGIVRLVAERGVCPSPLVQVSCAISMHTQDHLNSFVEAVGPLGVDLIVLNSLVYATAEQVETQRKALREAFQIEEYTGIPNHGAQIGVDPALLRRELATIRASRWAERVVMAPPGVEKHLEAYYAPYAQPFHRQICRAIFRELRVMPNGDVVACAHLHGLAMGNIREGSLLKAWNSPSFRRFRLRLAQGLLPTCTRCEKLTYKLPPR
jgi:radical SAM protein with 4Fe4S-binding SPASM domain